MTTVYEQVVLADSPLRLYPCNDGASPLADLSGNAQSAAVSGSPTYGATGLLNSEASTALENALTSYATIPTSGLPSGNSPLSLEVWVQCLTRGSSYRGIFSVGTQATYEAINIGYNSSNQIYAEMKNISAVTGPTTAINSIYHLVMTWDGTTLTLYVNGASQGTITPGAASITYGAAILDGFSDTSSRAGWTTQYAAIYGAALTSAQVTNHYNAGYSFLVSAALASGGGLAATPTALVGAALASGGALAAAPMALAGAALASGGGLSAAPMALVGAALASGGALSAQPSALVSAALASGGGLAAHPLALVSAALASGGTLAVRAAVLLPAPVGVSVSVTSGPVGVSASIAG